MSSLSYALSVFMRRQVTATYTGFAVFLVSGGSMCCLLVCRRGSSAPAMLCVRAHQHAAVAAAAAAAAAAASCRRCATCDAARLDLPDDRPLWAALQARQLLRTQRRWCCLLLHLCSAALVPAGQGLRRPGGSNRQRARPGCVCTEQPAQGRACCAALIWLPQRPPAWRCHCCRRIVAVAAQACAGRSAIRTAATSPTLRSGRPSTQASGLTGTASSHSARRGSWMWP